MKVRAPLILVAFVLFGAWTSDVRKNVQANGNSKGVVERASAAGAQNTPGLISAQETHSPATPPHFEPLLLLLLGSTLFSIGTAIKLILSRKLSPKSIRTATGRSSSPQS
jgi:hypothetical protein